ncbi:hypothetical protein J2S78_003331 [Salibacterium salarium]|nr:hypothetical protein [Salibacterium salarium]
MWFPLINQDAQRKKKMKISLLEKVYKELDNFDNHWLLRGITTDEKERTASGKYEKGNLKGGGRTLFFQRV